MTVFTHGSNVNFQLSAREMIVPELHDLLNTHHRTSKEFIVGTIHVAQKEMLLFGRLKEVTLNEDNNTFCISFLTDDAELITESQSLDHLCISHEAVFDVWDEEDRSVRLHIIYVTFLVGKEEQTYFFLEPKMREPLLFVEQFWDKVSDIGRDIDFSMSGCSRFERM